MRHAVPALTLLSFMLLSWAPLAWARDVPNPAHEQSQARALSTAPSPAQAATPDLAWLAGHWIRQEDARTSEEIWLPATRNLMLGINRTVHAGETRAFEFLRIELSATDTVYLASPGGREPTPFPLVSQTDASATFENPEHDFPQRIIYRREGDRLHARIEGEVDGEQRSMTWAWNLKSE